MHINNGKFARGKKENSLATSVNHHVYKQQKDTRARYFVKFIEISSFSSSIATH